MLLYQAALRAGTIVSHQALSALLDGTAGSSRGDDAVEARDVTGFSLTTCLHDNAIGVVDPAGAPLERMALSALVKLLERQAILAQDDSHLARRGRKSSPLDRSHVGNFHQQIGGNLLRRAIDPDTWWVDQKFQPDRAGFRENMYRWCQSPLLDDLFSASLKRQTWLDFGCGVGFYSRRMAGCGADVLGVDPNPAYVAAARELCPDARFEALQFKRRSDFESLRGKRFDRIFLSDVLLYFFEPYAPMELSAADLLTELAALLAPGGRILVLDPHGAFFLQARLAGGRAPLALCGEYRTRSFRVTPTLEEMSRAVEAGGLSIARIRELFAPKAEGAEAPDDRAFAAEFPAWWYFELEAAPKRGM